MADFGTSYLYGFTGTAVNKEDVLDMIINIDPFDTPLLNMAPKVPANHTTVEWLEDTLSGTATATRAEGQAFTQDTIAAASRVTNITQIVGKHITVSETQQAVSPYGFSDTFLYEVMKGTREVMRNIEVSLFRASGGSATGEATALSAGTARVMKSLGDFLTSNNEFVDSTAIGGGDSQSALSATTLVESTFNNFLQQIWENGGNPNFVFTAGDGKRIISGFDGQTAATASAITVNVNANEQQITRAVNSYLSDFGLINVVLDRFVPKPADATDIQGHIFILELPRVQVAFLRPVRFRTLAPDGDRVRGMVLGEYSLKMLAQKGSGKLFGHTTA